LRAARPTIENAAVASTGAKAAKTNPTHTILRFEYMGTDACYTTIATPNGILGTMLCLMFINQQVLV
jgi:hypothetical protein